MTKTPNLSRCAGEVGAQRRVRVIGSARSILTQPPDPTTLTLTPVAPRLNLSRPAAEASRLHPHA
jgi:hypothetical protein